MAPQLPVELINNIIDSHRHSDKKLLLSLLSSARCFKRARRYLYKTVMIDFTPRAKPLDVFLFLELLSFYGADIGKFVTFLDLRSIMLATKQKRALAALKDVISQLTALRDMDVHFEDANSGPAAQEEDYHRVMPFLASTAVQSLLVDGSAKEPKTIQGLTAANFRLLLSGMPNLCCIFARKCWDYILKEVIAFPEVHSIQRLIIVDLPLMQMRYMHLENPDYTVSGPREVMVPWWWFDRDARNLMTCAHAVIVDMGEKPLDPRIHYLAYHLNIDGPTEEIGFVFRGSFKEMFQTRSEREMWRVILSKAEHSRYNNLKSVCITLFCETEQYEGRKQSMVDLQHRLEDVIEQVGPLEKLKIKCQIVVRDDMVGLPVVSEDFLLPTSSQE